MCSTPQRVHLLPWPHARRIFLLKERRSLEPERSESSCRCEGWEKRCFAASTQEVFAVRTRPPSLWIWHCLVFTRWLKSTEIETLQQDFQTCCLLNGWALSQRAKEKGHHRRFVWLTLESSSIFRGECHPVCVNTRLPLAPQELMCLFSLFY